MNDLVKSILSLSLSGSLLIGILLLCNPLIKNKVSKRCQYYIWLIVIARLLLPFAPETTLMGMLFSHPDPVLRQTETSPQPEPSFLPGPEPDLSEPSPSPVPAFQDFQEDESVAANRWKAPRLLEWVTQHYAVLCLLVWFFVATGLLIRKITVYQSFVKYLEAGQIGISDVAVWERFGKLVEQMGIPGEVRLSIHPLISSPILIGLVHPGILLPTIALSETDFTHTIRHELMHYKRGDLFYKWLVQVTICVHWFNPFVYFMGREVNRACELSCDEAVIKTLDAAGRRAYGDTLLNAMKTGGIPDSLVLAPLNGKELLKERLDAIMRFQKTTRLTAAISIVLVFLLCFGATTVGAYTNSLPTNPTNVKENITNQPEQQNIPDSSPIIDNNLTLIEKEYTIDELKMLDISGVVVEALSENVTIARGGDTLRFEYYVRSQNEYTIQRVDDSGKTRWNLCLERIAPIEAGESGRSITVFIPDGFNITLIGTHTDTGDIHFENCVGKGVFAETKSGQININGGSVTGWMKVQTNSSNALISGTSLPSGDYAVMFETDTGMIAFQPKNSAQDYCFIVSTSSNAQITINGKKYTGGNYEINDSAAQKIYFDGVSGSFLVQDLSQGKLSLGDSTAQLVPTDNNNLILVKKEYTENDLQQIGVTGLRIEATTENIVVNQGGTSLIFEYYQSTETDYKLNIKEYEIYHGEFITPEDIAMNGGKSGMIKQLKLTSAVPPIGTARTIYITVPSDPKYSRVVQLFSDSGNIHLNGCKSTAMITAQTQNGYIQAQSCSSPRLGVETQGGDIEVSDCVIKELNSKTQNGTLSIELVDRADNYKMIIDTRTETQIVINGKQYQGGEFILNENATNNIFFDCYGNGSFVITENIK